MLSPEFTTEIGALVRALESQVRQHPNLRSSDEHDVLEDIDQAIVALIAVRMKLRTSLMDR
jgi:hypothetical protein